MTQKKKKKMEIDYVSLSFVKIYVVMGQKQQINIWSDCLFGDIDL